jgi:hypothetical protein
MSHTSSRQPQARKIEDARDLQSKLYREIGISAVAAALRFVNQPEMERPASTRVIPPVLRDEMAA